MKFRLIAAVSNDGFIAKFSGHLPNNWTSKEEKIYFKKDINSCGWSVMGRKTHELSFNKNKKRIIFTTSLKSYLYKDNKHLFCNPYNVSLDQIIGLIEPSKNLCILGGTKVHDYFLKKNLIDELIITVEPIYFKEGLPLFSILNWKDFPNHFLKKKLYKQIIHKRLNTNGTQYYHLIKN